MDMDGIMDMKQCLMDVVMEYETVSGKEFKIYIAANMKMCQPLECEDNFIPTRLDSGGIANSTCR